jgi:hypothetical protein
MYEQCGTTRDQGVAWVEDGHPAATLYLQSLNVIPTRHEFRKPDGLA